MIGHPRWVVHIAIDVSTRAEALQVAEEIAELLGQGAAPPVDPGSTEVSPEDEQSHRVPVYCNRLLSGGQRCDLPPGHTEAPCGVEVETFVADAETIARISAERSKRSKP